MTEEQRIEQLKTAPLVVPLTRRERWWQIVQKVCAVISVVSLAVAAVGIVLVFNLAICTNTNLGQRSAPAAKDAQAHIAFADIVQIAFTRTPPTSAETDAIKTAFDITLTPGVFPSDGQILHVLTAYPVSLADHQESRNAHPLGKC